MADSVSESTVFRADACGFHVLRGLDDEFSGARRRTVGLEAGAPPNAEGRSRGTSARRPTQPARRRAPRPAAGTFCRRRGCSHPRRGRFGNSGVGPFSLLNSSILFHCRRLHLRLTFLLLPSLVERPLSAPFCRPGPLGRKTHGLSSLWVGRKFDGSGSVGRGNRLLTRAAPIGRPAMDTP